MGAGFERLCRLQRGRPYATRSREEIDMTFKYEPRFKDPQRGEADDGEKNPEETEGVGEERDDYLPLHEQVFGIMG